MDEIDTELHFVEEQYDNSGQLIKTIELIPNGSKIRVRDATKLQYLDNLAQFRLATTIKDELDAFLKGLNELIPDNLLSIFDENELEVSELRALLINEINNICICGLSSCSFAEPVTIP